MRQILLDGTLSLGRGALGVLKVDDGRQRGRDRSSVAAYEAGHGLPAGATISFGRARGPDAAESLAMLLQAQGKLRRRAETWRVVQRYRNTEW